VNRTYFPPKLALPVSPHEHIRGTADAPVTLIEYADFQCSYCAMANPIIDKICKQLTDDLQFVYRHFPLSGLNPHAEHAAEIAEAAGAQGKFWEMHEVLYANQRALDDASLIEYAARIGLSRTEIGRTLAQHFYQDAVSEDFISGVPSGVTGTPTFFVNGLRHDGSYDYETLMSVIADAILGRGKYYRQKVYHTPRAPDDSILTRDGTMNIALKPQARV
jgi:protein-disulfide isomerase